MGTTETEGEGEGSAEYSADIFGRHSFRSSTTFNHAILHTLFISYTGGQCQVQGNLKKLISYASFAEKCQVQSHWNACLA